MSADRALTCDEVRDLAPAFVLDMLEGHEARAVRAHLATCGDPHGEIAELGSAVPMLWETLPLVEPPASLKSRLLAVAASDVAAASGAGVAAARPAVVAPTPIDERAARPGPVVAARRDRRVPIAWLVGIAAALTIVLLGAWNVSLQGQNGALEAQQHALAVVVRTAASPGSLTAVVSGPQPGGPQGLAALGTDGHLDLAVGGLPPTTGTEVYQAWVILPGSAPAPTGSFRVGDTGDGSIVAMPAPTAPGAIVAITLEPGPGAAAPTMPIVASGETRAHSG